MCGLTGQVGRIQPDSGAASNDLLGHRGPDDLGVWASTEEGCLLGSRRLAIQDLSPAGAMPMHSACGRYVIVFNGEVYNFLEIRSELEATGVTFRSHSDTEVILASYAQWGVKALHRFNGMFAIAIWDREDRQLFLARDRLGVKPLYYTQLAGRLLFSSEIKSFYADSAFAPKVNKSALSTYLTLGYVPWPQTLFHNVLKLPPAHYAIWKDGSLKLTRYWDPTAALNQAPISESDQAALFEDAVRLRLRSDVPVGLFLSGGVDSTYVAAVAERLAPEMKALTIGFDVPGSRHDESELAMEAARTLGFTHEVVSCTAADEEALLATLLWYLDEPVAENLIVPVFRLSAAARQSFTVALSGEGADETYFGYRYYTLARIRAKCGWLIRPFAPLGRRLLASAIRGDDVRSRAIRYLLAPDAHSAFAEWAQSFFRPEEAAALLLGDEVAEAPFERMREAGNLNRPGIDPAAVSPMYDLQFRMVDYILCVRDKTSMAASLELRCPFLDYRLVEAALANPVDASLNFSSTKIVLRRMASRILPENIAFRRKKPFAAPDDSWLEVLARRWLPQSELARDGYLAEAEIQRWCTLGPDLHMRHPARVIALLNLELWYRLFITRSIQPTRDVTPLDRDAIPVWERLESASTISG
ncbi:asparagine synthase (glutamine-hydrolyzing) [Mycolicibacterium aichiense]|uniref:asparagine synthase (glutamine-hydrolyzing) n=1 Tax=Mycolicibacterium aichiense TaxID=1799 RepID=UPI003D6770E5